MEYLAKMLVHRIDNSQQITDILQVIEGNADNEGNANKLRMLADALEKTVEEIPY